MLFAQERWFSLSMYIAVIVLCFFFIFSVLSGLKSSGGQGMILNGSKASSFETEFDKNLAHHSLSLSFWSRLNYILFKEGKEGVLIGDDGWFFTTEEFDYPKGFDKNVQYNLNYILSVKDRLSEIDVKLIVVPIPAKARVLENKLAQYKFPKYRKDIYGLFLKFLSDNKISSFDLFAKIDDAEKFFLKTDTHWSLEGAELTAELVADIVDLKSYKKDYIIGRGDDVAIEGDLIRYTVKRNETIGTVKLSGGSADDLFSDPTIPVALVGTSYSANKVWGFESWLKYYLQVDILNMADEGLGPFEVMKNYLHSNELQATKPKFVIWEIPERYLPVGNKDETLL